MKVTNKITIHLDDLREIRPVDVMQCDVHTRELEIALFVGGKKWEIPNSVTPVISYRKPDGTKGLYDTLPNGNPACRIEANVVRAVLPPSALEAPGRVDLVLIFTDDDDNQLAAFGVPVDVHRNPGVGAVASGDYFNLQKWVKETAVAAVPEALPNPQKLILTGAVAAEYDGSGEVEVEIPVGGSKDVHVGSEPPANGEAIWINPDEEPEGGGGAVSPEAIKQAVDEYMAEHPETDPTVPDWAKQPNKPPYTATEVGALPADTVIPETPEIPSALPNPQKLILTGAVEAEYDGSGEVKVEIPVEVGGSEKPKLIRTFEIAEGENANSVVIDTCDDGTSFAEAGWRKVAVKAIVQGPSDLTDYTSAYVRINGIAPSHGYGLLTRLLHNTARKNYFTVEAQGGAIILEYYLDHNHLTSGTQIASKCDVLNPIPQNNRGDVIASINIYNTSYAMHYGTKIEVWGVE